MERGRGERSFQGPGDELDRYFSMPKHFVGPETADELFSIYERLVNDPMPGASYFLIGGSAAAESGLVGTHLSNEERHRRIQCAHRAWEYAQELSIRNRYEKYESGEWTKSKLMMFSDRVEAQLIYTNLFHDLVNGNVRPETIASTHVRLVRLGIKNLQMHQEAVQLGDAGAESGRRGLAGEIATPASITRLQSPSFFAIPGVIRSDDGTYHRQDTHDVLLVQQKWGIIRSAVPIEVKATGRGNISRMRKNRSTRYQSAMVKGTIHLKMPSAQTPLHLAVYLGKELRGDATKQEIMELNDVTNMILDEARDYLQRTNMSRTALRQLVAQTS
jgi:hypothetical protein